MKQGAEQIPLVDLDGAFRGESKNLEQVERIAQAVKVPLELGGGIRSLDDISRFSTWEWLRDYWNDCCKNPKI